MPLVLPYIDIQELPTEIPVPVTEGGTGASDAATARANLGITGGLWTDVANEAELTAAFAAADLYIRITGPVTLTADRNFTVNTVLRVSSGGSLKSGGNFSIIGASSIGLVILLDRNTGFGVASQRTLAGSFFQISTFGRFAIIGGVNIGDVGGGSCSINCSANSANDTPLCLAGVPQYYGKVFVRPGPGENRCFQGSYTTGGNAQPALQLQNVVIQSTSNATWRAVYTLAGAALYAFDLRLISTFAAAGTGPALEAIQAAHQVRQLVIDGSTANIGINITDLVGEKATLDGLSYPRTGANGVTLAGPTTMMNVFTGDAGVITPPAAREECFLNIFHCSNLLTSAVTNLRASQGRVSGAIASIGVRCEFSQVQFLGGLATGAAADNSGFTQCQFGANAGGGALTLTITAGANLIRASACSSDAAIVDGGTGSALGTTSNTVY